MLRGLMVAMLMVACDGPEPSARDMCEDASRAACIRHVDTCTMTINYSDCDRNDRGGRVFTTARCCDVNLCEDTVSQVQFDSCVAQVEVLECDQLSTVPGPCRTLP